MARLDIADGEAAAADDDAVAVGLAAESSLALDARKDHLAEQSRATTTNPAARPWWLANLIKTEGINLNTKANGIDFAKETIKLYPFTEVIYITSYTSIKYTEEADETEPINYIVKPWNEAQIKVAIRIAFKYIDSKKENMHLMGELSHSEYRILSLIAQQKTSKLIGEELFISEKTVRNHRYNISKKLNLENNNNNLLKWAIANFSK